MGSPRNVTAFNCFVSGTIQDDLHDIFDKLKESGLTMKVGGGIGYSFSNLRPFGDIIKTLGSQTSGPVDFMKLYDSMCQRIAGAGHRRGAQMATLRVDHPDIMRFITAKHDNTTLTAFNMSVLITDKFMQAVKDDDTFDLVFEGRVYDTVKASFLWEQIMRSNWDWGEPGVIFIDRVNEMNNLYYMENITATNPCGEQPLPPYGACLLGSFCMVNYLTPGFDIDIDRFIADIPVVVRAIDNVIDNTIYPLNKQEQEAKNKRRMGLGFTGLANALEIGGFEYGSEKYLEEAEKLHKILANEAYRASAMLAKEKGSFPAYNRTLYQQSKFVKQLDPDVQDLIWKFGIRNSHLTSIAPTGTISLAAGNVSSGIEPTFAYSVDRTVKTFDGENIVPLKDFAVREYQVYGKKADDVPALDHVKVLAVAQKWTDSGVSKTCNVSSKMAWEDFKELYMYAWEHGCKGCTTFNKDGKRFAMMVDKKEEEPKVEACYIDPKTGTKECG